MPIPAETLAETPDIPRRITERQPNNLRPLIRQRTLRHLPHPVRNRRRLIKHQHNTPPLIVQTGKRLSVMLRPRHKIRPPRLRMPLIPSRNTHHRIRKPIRRNTQPLPLRHLGRSLSPQLRLRITRNNNLSIPARRQSPIDQHPDLRRLTDTVPARHRNHQRHKPRFRIFQMTFNIRHHPPLPLARRVIARQLPITPIISNRRPKQRVIPASRRHLHHINRHSNDSSHAPTAPPTTHPQTPRPYP